LWSLVVVLVARLLIPHPGLVVAAAVRVVLGLVLDCQFLEVYQLLLVLVVEEIKNLIMEIMDPHQYFPL
jgi:hypothetical protein